jgi:hypothetical protein
MWWMPRRLEAMKEVVACYKLRGAGKRALIRRYPNGETWSAMIILAIESERSELKHLSSCRKRNQPRFRE